jgi:hypothetical protein
LGFLWGHWGAGFLRREPAQGRGEISEVVRRATSGGDLGDDRQDLRLGQPEVCGPCVDGEHVGGIAEHPAIGGHARGIVPGGDQDALSEQCRGNRVRARATSTTTFF